MNRLLKCALAALLLLSPAASAFCADTFPPREQSRGTTSWDDLLDRYELICRKCLTLKQKQDAGEPVPSGQLLTLMDQLESLRSEIRKVSDKMPVAARRRFYDIRRMYATGVVSDTRPERIPAIARNILPSGATSHPASLPKFNDAAIPMAPLRLPHIKIVSATVSAPEMAYGISGQYWGQRLGAWAAVRSSFSVHRTAYNALSDGSSSDGRIWASGKAATDRFFATGGPLVRVSRNLAFFGGAGYGVRQLCWEDSEGEWMLVEDLSRRGFCFELGASLLLGRTAISASWLSLPQNCNSATIAVGFRF